MGNCKQTVLMALVTVFWHEVCNKHGFSHLNHLPCAQQNVQNHKPFAMRVTERSKSQTICHARSRTFKTTNHLPCAQQNVQNHKPFVMRATERSKPQTICHARSRTFKIINHLPCA